MMMESKNYTNVTTMTDSLNGWESTNYKCPYCGSTNTEYDSSMILTSNPPQSKCRCKDCGGQFFSGQCKSDWSNKDVLDDFWKQDQSILKTPKIGDPTPGESPYQVPFTPDPFHLNPPYKQNSYGWICPKCGRVLAPHLDTCKWCSIGGTSIATTPIVGDILDHLEDTKLTSDPRFNHISTSTSSETTKYTVTAHNNINREDIIQKYLDENDSIFEAVDKYKDWEIKNRDENK